MSWKHRNSFHGVPIANTDVGRLGGIPGSAASPEIAIRMSITVELLRNRENNTPGIVSSA